MRACKYTMLDYALSYAKLGFAVAPLKARSKGEFITEHGFNDATKDFNQIIRWWTRYPNANIAIATGIKSNLLVLDFDRNDNTGVYGADTLRDYQLEFGELKETAIAISGSGGIHYYYRTNLEFESTVKLYGSLIDIRAEGGCIVAPPSVHPNGKNYLWEVSSTEFADADDHVYRFILKGLEEKNKYTHSDNGRYKRFTLPSEILQGERDITIYKLACSLLARGVSENKALEILQAVNRENCYPPLRDSVIEEKLKSAIKFMEKAERRTRNGNHARRA